MPHPISRAACGLGLAAGLVCAAHAGTLAINFTDADGRPLPDAVALFEPATGKAAAKPMGDVDIAQKKRSFVPRVTVVTPGTRVNFPNFDTVRHHVYSFSAAKTFELKLYAGVPAQPVTFDKPGIAVLGCNIHDSMAAWVVVSDTPWFAQAGTDGKAAVDALPAGAYKLTLWHPGLPANAPATPVAFTMGSSDQAYAARIAVTPGP